MTEICDSDKQVWKAVTAVTRNKAEWITITAAVEVEITVLKAAQQKPKGRSDGAAIGN